MALASDAVATVTPDEAWNSYLLPPEPPLMGSWTWDSDSQPWRSDKHANAVKDMLKLARARA